MSNLQMSNGNGIQKNATTEMAMARQAQEVQAAMIVAKKFPRDEFEAIKRIKSACKRPTLAETATYQYPRGGTKVEGPSIRLAEVLAQHWGNLDFGIVELEQKNQRSTVMAYAWDLETNTRQAKVFEVPHIRYTKQGTKVLEDPRDIYEMVANQGARRLRACILGIIPGDVVDVAIQECDKTLAGNNDEDLQKRINKMLNAFKEFNVTKEMIESRLGYNLSAIDERAFANLLKVYNSLKDGMGSREDFFEVNKKEPKKNTKSSNSNGDMFNDAVSQDSTT